MDIYQLTQDQRVISDFIIQQNIYPQTLNKVELYQVDSKRLIFQIASNAGVNLESLQRAVKLFQYRFGLDVNGNLDEATLKLMSQPRCGDRGMSIKFREIGGGARISLHFENIKTSSTK